MVCLLILGALGPNDITPLGQDFDSNAQIEKLKKFNFPKSGGGKDQRSFQSQWLRRFDWIEYSISYDAAFCYVCRQYGEHSKEPTFTVNGYNNWRSALTDKKGFMKHSASMAHINAYASHIEKLNRVQSGKSVSELVSNSILEKRRYYCKSIVEVIMLLVENGLPLRGDWDPTEKEEAGLFNSFFEYALRKDAELVACQKHMPQNATYLSPQIQNEFISIMAHLVRESVVKDVKSADSGYFTILLDGTKDKNGIECVSIAARFVLNGNPVEALLFFESTQNLDAQSMTNLLVSSLESYGLDIKRIVSQCYDGASVMKGYKSGVAKRLQDLLEKVVPYVHCFNHRLRLVIIETVKHVSGIREFFDQIQLIYSAFKKPKIKKMYEGTAVKRLIETRWTGHFQSTKAVLENYAEIVSTLEVVENDKYNRMKLDGDDIATCIGILNVITRKKFVFSLVFMDKFLSALTPADAFFQSRETSYHKAMPVIEAVKGTITDYRTSDTFDECMEKVEQLIGVLERPVEAVRPTRKRKKSTLLKGFAVEESTGQRLSESDEIKSCFYEVIDIALAEIDARFTENHEILLALSKAPNMELNELKPLEKLGIELPLDYQMKSAKKYVDDQRKQWEQNAEKGTQSQFDLLRVLYEMRAAYEDVYKLYATIDTFACSTAVCEASFSALAKIDIPSRISMTNDRMRNLAFLAFEQKRLKLLPIDDVLKEFNNKKQRKVQLY